MIEELLFKYIAGNASDEEKETVVHWLDASPENMSDFFAMRRLHNISTWHQPESFHENNMLSKFNIKKNKVVHWGTELLKIAAVFLIAFFIYHYFLPQKKELKPQVHLQTIFVPAGQRAELILADGSKVWLNAKTTLVFPDHFEDEYRKVELSGEAYFDVAHDSRRPFTVVTEKYDINVLGTEFNIMAYKNSNYFEAALIKGSVDVISHKNAQKTTLLARTKAIELNNALMVNPIHDYNFLLWRNGIIYFEDETVTEMATKLEFYFDYKVDIKNKELSGNRFSGKFNTKDGIEHVFKVLQLKHKFHYEKDEEGKVITIK